MRGGAVLPLPPDGLRVFTPAQFAVLDAVGSEGRDGFYLGEFGKGLVAIGNGEYVEEDLSHPLADWVEPLNVSAWGSGNSNHS